MKTTVITPTIGTERLRNAIISVQNQSVRCKHLVVIDGAKHESVTRAILKDTGFYGDVIVLPENTGGEWKGYKWNGHRIYAGIPAIVNTDYISFLDEDNWYQPGFVETMERQEKFIVTCRRNIYSINDEYIGMDNFESIGQNDFGYKLHDTNTLFFNTMLYCANIAKSFYHPLEADKNVSEMIYRLNTDHIHIPKALVNYRCPERLKNFFLLNCDK